MENRDSAQKLVFGVLAATGIAALLIYLNRKRATKATPITVRELVDTPRTHPVLTTPPVVVDLMPTTKAQSAPSKPRRIPPVRHPNYSKDFISSHFDNPLAHLKDTIDPREFSRHWLRPRIDEGWDTQVPAVMPPTYRNLEPVASYRQTDPRRRRFISKVRY